MDYSEYIAQQVDNTINYSKYIAQQLDKTWRYGVSKTEPKKEFAFPTIDEFIKQNCEV